MMSFVLAEPPLVEPVSLAEMKAHARLDGNEEDALVTSLLVAARQWAERYMARALITQSWQAWADRLDGAGYFALSRPPLISVTEIKVFDESDAAVVWSPSHYFVDNTREPARVVLRAGATWPTPTRVANGIMIAYTAGYGVDGTHVPVPIRLAIMQLAAHWYEHRGEAVLISPGRSEAITRQGAVNVPLVIQALLDPYRIQRLRG